MRPTQTSYSCADGSTAGSSRRRMYSADELQIIMEEKVQEKVDQRVTDMKAEMKAEMEAEMKKQMMDIFASMRESGSVSFKIKIFNSFYYQIKLYLLILL